MDDPWYELVPKSRSLQQGDFIENMSVPEVVYSFSLAQSKGKPSVRWIESDWVIMGQSCDLNPKNKKAGQYIIVCPVTKVIEADISKETWGNILNNKYPYLHVLRHNDHRVSDGNYVYVDFREAKYAKLSVLKAYATKSGAPPRLRLKSPYLEAMSRRFGDYFSRVAYPVDFPAKEDRASFKSPKTW